jgi:hypothetical protein
MMRCTLHCFDPWLQPLGLAEMTQLVQCPFNILHWSYMLFYEISLVARNLNCCRKADLNPWLERTAKPNLTGNYIQRFPGN